MDWFDLRFIQHMPSDGHLLETSHQSLGMMLLAFLLACIACYTVLEVIERISQAQQPLSRWLWRIVGALCLGSGSWVLHFINQLPAEEYAQSAVAAPANFSSLCVATASAFVVMLSISKGHAKPARLFTSALLISLSSTVLHLFAITQSPQVIALFYSPLLIMAALAFACAFSYAALYSYDHQHAQSPAMSRLSRITASAALALAIEFTHSFGVEAVVADLASTASTDVPGAESHMALIVSCLALLGFAASLIAAARDKYQVVNQSNVHRVNSLLNQLDHARTSLQQAANYDVLTQHLNRRGLNLAFTEKLLKHQQTNTPLGVLVIDIDHFKRINDSLGHAIGDSMLKVIAERVSSALRNDDVLSRLGGDEFCVLASLKSKDEARVLAGRVLLAMKEPIVINGRCMTMTTSIGICMFPEDGNSPDELLKHAELALYQAKGSGRNQMHVFSSQLKAKASVELLLEEELHTALRSDQGLQLFYQPILNLHSGKLSKLEALVRWQHPQRGLLSPDRFIGIAEANGFIAELDNWVLRRACCDLSRLADEGHEHIKIAVNCSALNLGRKELATEVSEALLHFSVPAQRLELEVTENALMGNIGQAIDLLQELRAQGVSLSIDDFGTGYSSLAYLKRLPIDTLKIDRSFIQDIPGANEDMEIVQAIIAMAHSLRLKVVAEGVETPEQLDLLAKLKCDSIQGYLLSRPIPMQQLLTFLADFKVESSLAHHL
ncbi:putative bifunctional diguanylate cyclase/phosphodiesterase [Pseudomonas segetis]|uniref:cyclic-guanylate-specific phosphodiesterase n=1 Tax=Pseudomonas segetis TaxID=298908 RepID=A0A239C1P8_9PSED|nr:EAL domain-containing protein [Pseudomonas segetis]SNS13822.1 diguanylate cyclase/phosphodiesterase [Pseudomonas segetis]